MFPWRMKPDGILLVLFASVWFSGGSALIKALGADVPVAWVAFIRNVVALPFLYAALRAKGHPLASPNWPKLILRGVWGCLGMLCYFWAVPRMPLADSVLMRSTAPIFAAVLATAFMGERLDRRAVASIIVAFIGVWTTLSPDLSGISPVYLIALASGLFSSLAYTTMKSLTETEKPLRIIFYFGVVGSLGFLPGALASGYRPSPLEWGMMAGVGCFTTVGQLFLTWGIGAAPVSRASVGTLFLIVGNMALGWFFWNETPGPRTWTGCVLIALGIAGLTGGEAPPPGGEAPPPGGFRRRLLYSP